MMLNDPVRIVPATAADVPLILRFVKDLAEYERLTEDAALRALAQ